MAIDVIMPQMGESIAEGTITNWLKKVGDEVKRDEPLFEISTDKVDAEIPSPASGKLLEIKFQQGTTVGINTVVAVIGEAGEQPKAAASAPSDVPKPAPVAAPAAPAAAPAKQPKPPAAPPAVAVSKGNGHAQGASASAAGPASLEDRRRQKSSPVVRKIAAEHGVDLAALEGTGISGRVTKTDILGFLQGGGSVAATIPARPVAPSGTMLPSSARPSPAAGSGEIPDAYRPRLFEGDTLENLSAMRGKIAEHMVWSRRIAAHVQTVFEADFSHVEKLRNKHKGIWEQRHGQKLTFTHFILKATVDALKAFPVLNASLDDQRVIYHRDVNLGLAVALDWGLIVPVIHRANELNLLGLARRSTDLGERARVKKLKPDEVQAGTFTITNPGQFGNLFGLPIINQPQVAILGVGGIEKRPVVVSGPEGDSIAIRSRAYLSLSFDHRLVDGAVADQFMARLKKNLQEFDEAELG